MDKEMIDEIIENCYWLSVREKERLFLYSQGKKYQEIGDAQWVSGRAIYASIRAILIQYAKQWANLEAEPRISHELIATISSMSNAKAMRHLEKLHFKNPECCNVIHFKHLGADRLNAIGIMKVRDLTIHDIHQKTGMSINIISKLLSKYTASEIIARKELIKIDRKDAKIQYSGSSAML